MFGRFKKKNAILSYSAKFRDLYCTPLSFQHKLLLLCCSNLKKEATCISGAPPTSELENTAPGRLAGHQEKTEKKRESDQHIKNEKNRKAKVVNIRPHEQA